MHPLIQTSHHRTLRLLLAALVLLIVVPIRADAQATPEVNPHSAEVRSTFYPVADTYVVETSPDSNFGDRTTLVSDQAELSVAYLQFQVTGSIAPVASATVRLRVTGGTEQAPTLWMSPPVPLAEKDVTWVTRPPVDTAIQSKEAGASQDSWLEYDVTSVVNGDGLYTFALVPESTDGLDVFSRESEEYPPELVVESADAQLTPPSAPEGDVPVLLAAGDIAACDDGAEQTARILDDEPGTVATLGDNAYPDGTAEQFSECYEPTWGRHKDRTMPSAGNHDYNTAGAEGYYAYFGAAAGNPNEGYYAYTLGSWSIIVVNTNIDMGEDSAQMAWFRDQVVTAPAQCTLVYGHHPRFSSGEHGSNSDVGPLFSAMYDYGVEVYLSGHDHDYERFAPQDSDGVRDDVYGVRQFVVGTGGKALRGFNAPLDTTEVRSADAFGIIRITLHEDRYEWQFLAAEGESFHDSGRTDCHDAPDHASVSGMRRVSFDQFRIADTRRFSETPRSISRRPE